MPIISGGALRACFRWIASVLGGTALLWLAGLAGLLALANLVHVDIPAQLARKLPLLQSHPRLIFAGESRTEFGVDPLLAAKLLHQAQGYAVNIAYEAGEPLAVMGAAHAFPEVFRDAHVVLSVAPFNFNEGVRSAAVYPLGVAARLTVPQQLATFLPLRLGTLIRYIRSAFAARLADIEGVAIHGPVPAQGGVLMLNGRAPDYPNLGRHPHYQGWDISGPRARGAVAAMCELARLSRKLTVVEPPWIPGDRSGDAAWLGYEADTLQLLQRAAERCGFRVINMAAIAGLSAAEYSDEMHVNQDGMPIYTRALIERLDP
ncbi:hypothetical protein [Bradyrhizobium sp. HKCCYLS20291]|uniref:hypothetical protein n=1 Tax=Bradyrhizobium sp. HKCCYLS20291 TaxID=3420766 RepID=UPI003EC112F8